MASNKSPRLVYGLERTGYDSSDTVRFIYGNNPGSAGYVSVAVDHTMRNPTFTATGSVGAPRGECGHANRCRCGYKKGDGRKRGKD